MDNKKVTGSSHTSEVSPLVLEKAEKYRSFYFLEANRVESNTVTSEPEPDVREHLPTPELEEEEFGSRTVNVSTSFQALFISKLEQL